MNEPFLRALSLGAGVRSTTLALMAAKGEIVMTADPRDRRMVGDPVVSCEASRVACLYGAAMMHKVSRLPSDMAVFDVHFQPPATLVFVAADGSQAEVGRYVIPDRVLTYDPRPRLMAPEDDAGAGS